MDLLMDTYELVFDSPLGFIQMQQQNGKLCLLKFLDDKPSEGGNNASEFLLDCESQLKDYFNGVLTNFRFIENTIQTGTPFQQKVWKELQNIPFGKSISYLQLAINLGDEKCIRAAASANGKNNIAIAVPCHRVIGTDGSLTGYAGELWRKKWLLEHEAKFSGHAVQALLF
jgi:methylated-DNA-[protein]-cysteine S-methyltransferase